MKVSELQGLDRVLVVGSSCARITRCLANRFRQAASVAAGEPAAVTGDDPLASSLEQCGSSGLPELVLGLAEVVKAAGRSQVAVRPGRRSRP